MRYSSDQTTSELRKPVKIMPRKIATLPTSRRKGASTKSDTPDIAEVLASLKKILVEDGLLPHTKH